MKFGIIFDLIYLTKPATYIYGRLWAKKIANRIKIFKQGSIRSSAILNPAKSMDFLQNWNFLGFKMMPALSTFDRKSIVRHQ